MTVDFSGVYPMLISFDTADDRVDHALWRALINATGGVIRVFVGRGGLDMVDELRAGAVGIIPGVGTLDRTPRIFDDRQFALPQ